MDDKAPDAFRTISEVADELDLPQHVLRFWESRFHEIKPMKRGGGRRYYRPADVKLLRGIRHLLYGEGYTIKGAQRVLHEQGIKFVQMIWQGEAPSFPHSDTASEDFADDGVETVECISERTDLDVAFVSRIDQNLSELQNAPDDRREPQFGGMTLPRNDFNTGAINFDVVASGRSEMSAGADAKRAAMADKTLAPELLHKLQAALGELAECRNLINAAMAD